MSVPRRFLGVGPSLLCRAAIMTAFGLSGAAAEAPCPLCAAADLQAAVPQASRRSAYALDASWETDAGALLKLGSLRGRPAVVALFFTTCHVACPITVETLSEVDRDLPAASSVPILLVTIDPQTDTVSELAQCRAEHALSGRFTLVRGALADTQALADATGIAYRREASRLVHMPKIVVLDRAGNVAASFPGLRVNPRDVARAAASLEAAGSQVASAP